MLAALRRYILPVIAFAIIGICVLCFVLLRQYSPFASVTPPIPPNIALALENVETVGRSHGKKAWKFKARLVQATRDRVNWTFKDVSQGIVYDHEKPALTLSAGEIEFNKYTSDIQARKTVRARLKDEIGFATERVNWVASRKILVCPGMVSIDMKTGKGTAGSLVADLENGELVVRNISLKTTAPESLIFR